MLSSPLDGKHGRTASGVACNHRPWQHTLSSDVGRGMPSSPLGSTDGRTVSGVACHHRPWTAQTVDRRRAWHAIIALGQNTRSNGVGHGMLSSPLDSTDGRPSSGVACHHRLRTAQTVGHRRAWHAIIALGPAQTVGNRRARHAIIPLGQHTRSDGVGNCMPSSPLDQHRRSAIVGRGMPSSPLDSTNGRPSWDVPAHNGQLWPARICRGLRDIVRVLNKT